MERDCNWHNVQMSVIYSTSGISASCGGPVLEHDRMPILAIDELLCLDHECPKFLTFPFHEVAQGHHVTARYYQKPALHEGAD